MTDDGVMVLMIDVPFIDGLDWFFTCKPLAAQKDKRTCRVMRRPPASLYMYSWGIFPRYSWHPHFNCQDMVSCILLLFVYILHKTMPALALVVSSICVRRKSSETFHILRMMDNDLWSDTLARRCRGKKYYKSVMISLELTRSGGRCLFFVTVGFDVCVFNQTSESEQ